MLPLFVTFAISQHEREDCWVQLSFLRSHFLTNPRHSIFSEALTDLREKSLTKETSTLQQLSRTLAIDTMPCALGDTDVADLEY